MIDKITQFNQAVRSIVTLGMAFGVLYGFLVARLIGADVFVPLASGVITWWFVRDQASATTKEASELIKLPPPGNGTTTTTTTTINDPTKP